VSESVQQTLLTVTTDGSGSSGIRALCFGLCAVAPRALGRARRRLQPPVLSVAAASRLPTPTSAVASNSPQQFMPRKYGGAAHSPRPLERPKPASTPPSGCPLLDLREGAADSSPRRGPLASLTQSRLRRRARQVPPCRRRSSGKVPACRVGSPPMYGSTRTRALWPSSAS